MSESPPELEPEPAKEEVRTTLWDFGLASQRRGREAKGALLLKKGKMDVVEEPLPPAGLKPEPEAESEPIVDVPEPKEGSKGPSGGFPASGDLINVSEEQPIPRTPDRKFVVMPDRLPPPTPDLSHHTMIVLPAPPTPDAPTGQFPPTKTKQEPQN